MRKTGNLMLIVLGFGLSALFGCVEDSPSPQDTLAPDAGIDTDPDLVIEPPDVDDSPRAESLTAERVWPAEAVPPDAFIDCAFASPLIYRDDDGEATLLVGATETVRGLNPATGQARWSVTLPAPDGRLPFMVATPVVVEAAGRSLLVVAYHTSGDSPGRNVSNTKHHHYAAVIDLDLGRLAEDFPLVELTGAVPANTPDQTVPFLPDHALIRATLAHVASTPEALGQVIVTMGNTRDIQPWHGWLFALDLAAWQAQGTTAAIATIFTTTPEADCGPQGASGSRERICGGGLWAPSGPLVIPDEDDGRGPSLILAPGNGQLDLRRQDYANTLMRVWPLAERADDEPFFDPACDAQLCADYNPDAPAPSCTASCANLWVPQLSGVDLPNSETCAGMTPLECWGALDYIGGSTPVRAQVPGGPAVLAYPTKDGALYLVDADHLGRQYDRRPLVATCGTPDDPCRWDWAGMIVNQPVLTEVDGTPVVITPTFMPDNTHPAGVVALKIVMDGDAPRFEPYWQFPRFDTAEALQRFRVHSARPTLGTVTLDGEPVEVVWLVEARRPGDQGRLLGLDVLTGQALIDEALPGPGIRFARTLAYEDMIFLNSCERDEGRGHVEAWRINTIVDAPTP